MAFASVPLFLCIQESGFEPRQTSSIGMTNATPSC